MKYELDKEEFIIIHTSMTEMFSKTLVLIESLAHNAHDINIKRLELDLRKQEFEEAQAGLRRVSRPSFEDASEEYEEELPPEQPLPFPKEVFQSESPRTVEPTVSPPPPKAEIDDEDIAIFFDFMEVWLTNFNVEGPQPDRAEELRNMTINGHAGKIHRFFTAHGGMTKSVRAYLIGTDHPKKDDRNFAFLVASNMCSVASIIYPPLIDQFDYINPS